MDINEKFPFLHSIFQLRKKEEMILYSKMVTVGNEEATLVLDLLEEEYQSEQINYPFDAPDFDREAALWAAKTLYTIAQLILYRADSETEIEKRLPAYEAEITAAAILSADLCLRFLTQVSAEANIVDPDDVLHKHIEKIANTWHYSAIGGPLDVASLHFGAFFEDPCLMQLYTDRIVLRKDKKLAALPEWNTRVKSLLGIHQQSLWPSFE